MSNTIYEQAGIAQFLGGMRRAREILTNEIEEMEAALAALQGGKVKRGRGRPPKAESARQAAEEFRGRGGARKGAGRPRGVAPVAPGGGLTAHGTPLKAGFWANLTAEERSAEMARRQAKRKITGKVKALHPRDVEHPDHEKWLATMAAAQRRRWAGMSKKERAEQMAKMTKASVAARRLNGAAVEAVQ